MSRWRRLKFEIRTFLGKYPEMFIPITAVRHRRRDRHHWLRPQLIAADTELVVEGFPRSGNTFSIAAFFVAMDERLPQMAHHLHVPAQLIQAARRGTPAIALIRRPVDAIASTMVHDPRLGPKQLIRAYLDFYRPLETYKKNILIAPFDLVTKDFGVVIEQLNLQFGTTFPKFVHSPENVDRCFKLIEERNSMYTGNVTENRIARPSTSRSRSNESVRSLLEDGRLRSLMSQADEIYGAFMDHARTQFSRLGQTHENALVPSPSADPVQVVA